LCDRRPRNIWFLFQIFREQIISLFRLFPVYFPRLFPCQLFPRKLGNIIVRINHLPIIPRFHDLQMIRPIGWQGAGSARIRMRRASFTPAAFILRRHPCRRIYFDCPPIQRGPFLLFSSLFFLLINSFPFLSLCWAGPHCWNFTAGVFIFARPPGRAPCFASRRLPFVVWADHLFWCRLASGRKFGVPLWCGASGGLRILIVFVLLVLFVPLLVFAAGAPLQRPSLARRPKRASIVTLLFSSCFWRILKSFVPGFMLCFFAAKMRIHAVLRH
jgi:hypothetical protein